MTDSSSAIEKTHVIELTPRGRAAVAVILVAGPRAVAAVDACFAANSGRLLADQPLERIVLGRWRAGSQSKPDREEVIVCRRADDRVEVHCHGGIAAIQAVVGALAVQGCRATGWRDWLRASERDPLRAAARIALADAPTARVAAILLEQYHGALSAVVRAALESAAAGRWEQSIAGLDAVLAWRELGIHLTVPWRVVLVGPPNVGKSSLLNAMAGFQRAIVSATPGTTRDVVTLETAIDGWPVQLADTAGLRYVQDELEAAGVALAGAALADADLAIVVHDASGGHAALPAGLSPGQRVLHVCNKIDLPPGPAMRAMPGTMIPVSAKTGQGLAALLAAIGRALVPATPLPEAAVPFEQGHLQALEAARHAALRRDLQAVLAALRPLSPP
jgi:tRNA modification GTPase